MYILLYILYTHERFSVHVVHSCGISGRLERMDVRFTAGIKVEETLLIAQIHTSKLTLRYKPHRYLLSASRRVVNSGFKN